MADYLAHQSDIHLIPPLDVTVRGAIGGVKRRHAGAAVLPVVPDPFKLQTALPTMHNDHQPLLPGHAISDSAECVGAC